MTRKSHESATIVERRGIAATVRDHGAWEYASVVTEPYVTTEPAKFPLAKKSFSLLRFTCDRNLGLHLQSIDSISDLAHDEVVTTVIQVVCEWSVLTRDPAIESFNGTLSRVHFAWFRMEHLLHATSYGA